jgi:[FeFe] hydrogenase H-cluster maturation GTPase HydF
MLSQTPTSGRVHISIFGKRNSGKSSLINAVTNQEISIVSDVLGTTTDPVYKSMELLPLGPVVIIDTPGYDDAGELGDMRVKKMQDVLAKTDLALLVIDMDLGFDSKDEKVLNQIIEKSIPYIKVYNKCDIKNDPVSDENSISVSAEKSININSLKERIVNLANGLKPEAGLVADIINEGDIVLLVVPIDSSAPKGRLILPQQQVIREVLDLKGICMISQDSELASMLNALKIRPKLVITDSQVFDKVSEIVPDDINLTSFSILFARKNGILNAAVSGAAKLDYLEENDTILISEGCTHHRQCEDIGTVKLPKWIREHTGQKLNFEFTSGTSFPKDLSRFSLVVHCGGCMLNTKEVKHRFDTAKTQNVSITNYGTAIAHLKGILNKSIRAFS